MAVNLFCCWKIDKWVYLVVTWKLEYIGRIDNQIKLRGIRVEISEIENIIANFESISDAKVLIVSIPVNALLKVVPEILDTVADDAIVFIISNNDGLVGFMGTFLGINIQINIGVCFTIITLQPNIKRTEEGHKYFMFNWSICSPWCI